MLLSLVILMSIPFVQSSMADCPGILQVIEQVHAKGQYKVAAYTLGKDFGSDVEVLFGNPRNTEWTKIVVTPDAKVCEIREGKGLLVILEGDWKRMLRQ